jgi:5-methylcytosine-specific restriction protein A
MPTKPPIHAATTTIPPGKARYQASVDDGSASFFNSRAWDTVRVAVLLRDPLCKACNAAPSWVADHVTPRRLLPRDRWLDVSNIQGLCSECHNAKTAKGL